MAKKIKLTRLQRNFFTFITISIILLVLLKITSRKLRTPGEIKPQSKNLEILATAMAKYGVENDGEIPRRLSELYPRYCNELSAFTSALCRPIDTPEEIDTRTSFKLNVKLPERFEDIHLKSSLIVLTDTAEYPESQVPRAINANLDVVALTDLSHKVFGFTSEPADLIEKGFDEDGDGRTDEKQFLSDGEIMYSVRLLRNPGGRLVRETWYDSRGEVTSDYGPSFRMYNYDNTGKLRSISNHRSSGSPMEILRVAQIRFKYKGEEVIIRYYRADGSILAILRKPIAKEKGPE